MTRLNGGTETDRFQDSIIGLYLECSKGEFPFYLGRVMFSLSMGECFLSMGVSYLPFTLGVCCFPLGARMFTKNVYQES
jgi:hypothetical protein